MANKITKILTKITAKKKVTKKVIAVEPREEKEVKHFDVFDQYGVYVRTYHTDLHGNNAEEMAKSFALKIKGEIK